MLEARQGTDRLLDVTAQELALRGFGPKIIAGGLNGDPDDFEVFRRLVNCEGWTDIGAHASRWWGEDALPTCQASGRADPTRRDYMLVNDVALALVSSFSLLSPDVFPTHTPLCMTLDVGTDHGRIYRHVRPP